MADEKLVPKLRFAGFTDNWEEITIKDYSTIKGRIGWRNLKQSEYTESGPYLIAGKHIHNGIINWDECDHLSVERYEESPEIALKKGDVIFSKDGSLGNPALIKELPSEATINGTMMLVRLNNKVSPNFFYQILNSDYFFRLLHILKSGSSIPHIFQRDMENFKFKIPNSYEEQNKISKFLENIDKKIELLEKKHNTYVNFKKYLMQQIFAQKLRFDYEDEWETTKLENISKVTGGKRMPKGSELINEPNNHPYITVSNMNNNFEDLSTYQYVPPEIFPQIKNYIVNHEDLIISVAGTLGVVKKVPKCLDKANLTENANRISEIKINIDYLHYYLNTSQIQNRILSVQTNNAQPKLALKEVRNFKIKYPSFEEQENIVNLLFNIDKKIQSIDFNLKHTNYFKKGLLQQMFI